MPVRDFRGRIPDCGPMILYRITLAVALTVCLVLAVSASAKEPQSASVKREFQLTHRCPATGLRSGAYPGYVKDHVRALKYGGPDAVSKMQWQTTADAKAKDKWENERLHSLGCVSQWPRMFGRFPESAPANCSDPIGDALHHRALDPEIAVRRLRARLLRRLYA
jgi:hypothetical protein